MAIRFDERFQLRMSVDEKERINKCADELGIKPTQFIRLAIRQKLTELENISEKKVETLKM